ncbi:DUF2892 domain-containing protein [Niabella sp. CC-SYL272]|uniref:YgaP family membrane protein n=1 Tax=Niabella agricola TaxID=2891571 RepID=UPI001F41ECE3|nr:DUF2892 domain-containing protein [Niabella agricola]MCF3107628.1 DUF2892 domain-containing protein [Niabella agricola]
MKKNIGTTDKIVRLLVAIVIIAGYWTNLISGVAAIMLGILAGVLLLTVFIGFCPLYVPFGIDTNKKKKQ